MIIFLDFWSDVGGAIIEALRSLMLSLCEIIYRLIIFFFDIFIMLGNAEIMNSDKIMEIYERVGLILGIFMIFRVTFSLIQYVINPDLFLDQKKGLVNVVKKIFIVIILLGITPSVFRMAYDLQNKIINSEIIPKVIIGANGTNNVDDESDGEKLAWYSFSTFYSWNEEALDSITDVYGSNSINALNKFYDHCIELQGIDNNMLKDAFMSDEHSLSYAFNCVNTQYELYNPRTDQTKRFFVIDFDGNGLLPVITGGIILWMVIMYTIQVGIRIIQLAYLQLIAPIPIITYLTPKGEETFNKWIKQCTSTYLDFFIRVAIIYFVIFVIDFLIGENSQAFQDSLGDVNGLEMSWINIVVIVSLLLFAKKVPDLLKDLFPNMGGGAGKFSFGFSPKKVLNDTWAAGAIGAVGGAAGAGLSNAIHGYRNTKKAFKDNGGWKSGKAWWSATGAAFKGVGSVTGGVLGGARAGLKTKDITNIGQAVRVANENREKRELKAKAGYTWYRPDKVVADKILGFAGETTGAEAAIKTAEFRKDALQQAKSMQWKNFSEVNEPEITAGNIDLSLLRSMQEFEEKGKKVWRGINTAGKERSFIYDTSTKKFVANDGGTALTDSGRFDDIASKIVMDSAKTDEQIKKQGKIIKGLETASRDAKK